MDIDPLRIILLTIGIVVVAGIYTWGRRRSAAANGSPGFEQPGSDAIPTGESGPEETGTPFVALDDGDPVGEWEGGRFTARAETDAAVDELAGLASSGAEESGLVIVVTLMANGEAFSGPSLLAAIRASDLHFSTAGVFHYYPEQEGCGGEPWFGIANVLEPGTFDLEAMDDFSTPGLVIFLQLPGPAEGAVMFDRMIVIAHSLAEQLGGQLCDGHRQPVDAAWLHTERERVRSQDALSAGVEWRSA